MSSSFNASSSTSSTSQCLVRQQSYTHSFPSRPSSGSAASTSGERQGLSPATRALAKQAFEVQQDNYARDRTMLFFGGLQWLLDSTVEATSGRKTIMEEDGARKPSLTEDAVRTFDVLDKTSGRVIELGNCEETDHVDRNRTNAWLSDQAGSG